MEIYYFILSHFFVSFINYIFSCKKTLYKLLIVANQGNKDLLLRNLANVAYLFVICIDSTSFIGLKGCYCLMCLVKTLVYYFKHVKSEPLRCPVSSFNCEINHFKRLFVIYRHIKLSTTCITLFSLKVALDSMNLDA